MKNANLRNIGIVSHVDAGKTTVTENLLYLSGAIRTLGDVNQGTTHTDWLDIERQRGISVRAASTSFQWKNVRVNLIDTPGHNDFAAEVERSLRVLDGAILLVSAVEGVQAQTELYWQALREMRIPTIVFVNKIDRAGSNALKVLGEIRQILTPSVIPIQRVCVEGSNEPAIESVFRGDANTSASYMAGSLLEMVEFLADFDEEILRKFVEGEHISGSELLKVLRCLSQSGRIFPLLYGSAQKGVGVEELMDAVLQFLPPPAGNPAAELSGVIFRIEHDPNMGKIAHLRLYSGNIKNRDLLPNLTQGIEEKVTQIRKVSGQKHEDVGALAAGDIAALFGLRSARVGDVLGSAAYVPPGYRLANTFLTVQAFPETDADYPDLVGALQELTEEDPLLEVEWQKEKRELRVKIMGVIQLEILTGLLKERFNLTVTFGPPSVIYKETPTTTGEGMVRYTMPKPCWAVLRFLIEPGERGSGLVYSSTVRDEDILYRYQRQVEKTMPQALEQGLYGWEVTDLRVTLIAGESHVMHTHPLDFVVATPMGIMNGLVNTGTTLLEPLLHFRVSVPEEVGSKVLGDVMQMRGVFDSPVIAKGLFTVEAKIPVATSLDYSVRLGIISGGRGNLQTSFLGYQECPLELGATTPRRGVDPLDRAKYILHARKAMGGL